MKKTALFLLLLCASVAHATDYAADDFDQAYNEDYTETVMYVGGSIGETAISGKLPNSRSMDVRFGMQFSPNTAAEFGYSQLGAYNNPVNLQSASVSALHLSFVGKMNLPFLSERWGQLYGRVGVAQSTVSVTGAPARTHDDATYGVGYQVALGAKSVWHLRIGYDQFLIGSLAIPLPPAFADRDHIDSTNVALLYHY